MSTPKAADTPVTKRLHVSGLTPNITIDDLSKRLSTFGTVTALDKFGEKDAVDQVKKFGYVTLETTQGKLARSERLGKAQKLRIGEAKPDWRERLEKERSSTSPPKPKKPKRYGKIHANDMSLITPTTAPTHPGWKVTPLGRVLHPVKMRPGHPLPPTKEEVEVRRKEEEAARKGKVVGKKRKRVKEPDTRARRRTIDVTKWGSTHLKGAFLDAVVADGGVGLRSREEEVGGVQDVDMSSEESSEEEEEVLDEDSEEIEDADEMVPSATTAVAHSQSPPAVLTSAAVPAAAAQPAAAATVEDETDITAEKSRSLNLLASLFGKIDTNDLDDDDDDWAGRESVGSDIDEEALKRSQKDVLRARVGEDGDDDEIEVVPMDGRGKKKAGKERRETVENTVTQEDEEESEEEEEEDVYMEEPETVLEKAASSPQPAPAPQVPPKQKTNLKDLFAPREEEAGFSLIGHLDLDLELDDEVPFAIGDSTTTTDQDPVASTFNEVYTSQPTAAAATTRAHKPTAQTLHLDPKKPLFFPHRPSSSDQPITKARPKDILEHFVELGWGWRGPPGSNAENTEEKEKMFYRTGTEEEIRKRWEERKVELTREWKRRHKEASKFSRRRRGGDAGDGELV